MAPGQPFGSSFNVPQPADPIVKDFRGFAEDDGFLVVIAAEGLPMAGDIDPLLGRFEFQAGLISRAGAFQGLSAPASFTVSMPALFALVEFIHECAPLLRGSQKQDATITALPPAIFYKVFTPLAATWQATNLQSWTESAGLAVMERPLS